MMYETDRTRLGVKYIGISINICNSIFSVKNTNTVEPLLSEHSGS